MAAHRCDDSVSFLAEQFGGGGRVDHGNAGVNVFKLGLALQSGGGGHHALIAHVIGVLGHGAQQAAVLDQVEDRVGLVEAHAHDGVVVGGDGIAHAHAAAFVRAEQADDALGDIVIGDFLAQRGIAIGVLGFEDFKAGIGKRLAEAFLALGGGSRGGIDVHERREQRW